MRCQVFAFGHSLSPATKAWLSQNYVSGYRVHKVFFHAEKLSDTPAAAEQVFHKLRAQGADFSGQTQTLFVLPGLGAGVAVLVAGWVGITGDFPQVLNLMKFGDGYAPSPELPVIDLGSFKNQVGRKMRARFFEGVETSGSSAADAHGDSLAA
jgi:hypothetical protein